MRFADAIHLRLLETRQLDLGAVRRLNQIACLLYRHQVLINRHDAPPQKAGE
jgi:hypothetical protein